MAHLSELTHCLARMHIPSFEQCKQIRTTLARRSLSGVAPARQETGVFPRQEYVRPKKKKKETRKEEGKTFRSERTVNFGPKSQRFLNQKVFVHFLSSAPFLSMLRRRRAPAKQPQAGLCLVFVCILDKLSLRRATPRRFLLSKKQT